ncbi:MAG: hypothetical protein HQK49_00395 [Oligoflexia bacterium]|nr:hypothetical protein [Oligoflexia bacterium]
MYNLIFIRTLNNFYLKKLYLVCYFILINLFLSISNISSVHAIELEKGKYEIIGRYLHNENALLVYEGTEAEFKLFLLGNNVLTSFLKSDQYHYLAIIDLHKKIVNHSGFASLVGVKEIKFYDSKERQYKRLANAN